MSVTIDPRRHDAVLFHLGAVVTSIPAARTLVRQLQAAGVDTAVYSASPDCPDDLIGDLFGVRVVGLAGKPALNEAANRLGARPGRCVVVDDSEDGVTAGREGGFALVIGVDRTADLGEIAVRTGDRRMSELPDAMQALDLLTARQPAVFFDFDGTLSDIVDDPDAARLVVGAAEALRALAAHCPVAVLSGRDLADVAERVGLPGIWYAGSHGFELTAPDGTHHQNEAAVASIPVLEQVTAQLRDRLGMISGVVVEHKRFGVAVHYRNAALARVDEVAAAVREAGQRTALRVTTGREVIELRPNIDWDKGKTLLWVVDHLRDAEPVLPVYLGDDITDEDAFDAVRDDGIPIVVRHTEDGNRATAAQFALDSPTQVCEFTERLARQLSGSRA